MLNIKIIQQNRQLKIDSTNMKNKPLLFLLSVCGLLAISARGENPPAKVIFEQYMNQAQTFADNYPREKAYLHFDNTSYYVGDTIWFKAYVTLAEKQVFSQSAVLCMWNW